MIYPIPKSSKDAWLQHKNKSPQNPGLIFGRFVQDWGSLQGKDKEAKRKAWVEIAEAAQKTDQNLLRQWNLRWQATVGAARAKAFSMKTGWRFIAGLGNKGALEVGFTFHRYGFPLLPGSSVKGIARAWGLNLIAENLAATCRTGKLDEILSEDEEKKFMKKLAEIFPEVSDEAVNLAKNFRAIFGTPGCSGLAIFFDGIPIHLPKLELDVMNPHYSDYYQDQSGKTPPASWLSPVPIYFLTVAKDSEFKFAVGWRTNVNDAANTLQSVAEEWLKAGLKNFGAGAKTSAGYGYFADLEENGKTLTLPLKDQTLSNTQEKTTRDVDPDQVKADQIIVEIKNIKTAAVAGCINQFYQRWCDENISPAQKRRIAEVIVAKVKEAGREKQSLGKMWYKEIMSFLTES